MKVSNKHFLALCLLLLSSCATVKHQYSASEVNNKIDLLTHLISKLSPNVIPREANKVASIAVLYPLQLTKDYRLTDSPIVHNMMVNHGIRERGLCIHWTEDLMRKLATLKVTSLKFYWGVANREATFRLEHSSVIVSPSELSFHDGIVLDGWRDSGNLYFSPVTSDKYDWKPHFNDVTAELYLKE